MNKKAFTLVELLGVIVVLAILSGLAVYSMSGVIGTGKQSVYKNYEDTLKSSIQNYFIDNPNVVPSSGTTIKFNLNEMIEKGYINELKAPDGGDCSSSYANVSREKSKINYDACLICKDSSGNVLYKSSNSCS